MGKRKCGWRGLYPGILLPFMFMFLATQGQGEVHWSGSFSMTNAYQSNGYGLSLSSSSPACLDSHVKFTANVSHVKENATEFIFVWIIVDQGYFPKRRNSSDYDELYETFDGETVTSGNFTMVVDVFTLGDSQSGNTESRVATGNLTFYLGGNLNIDISAQQEIKTRRHQRIFSTGTGVQFSAVLNDNFTNPVVYHSWIFSGPATIKPVVNSTKSQIEIHGQKAGKYTLILDAQAEYNVTEWGPRERRHKEGNVTYLFELKDPVTVVNASVPREEKITVSVPINITITCDGSPPFVLSWNISKLNNLTAAGTAGITSGLCIMELNQNFSSPGLFTISVEAVNDVGSASVQTNFTVSPAEIPVGPVPAYIPVICVLIGLSVIITILVTYWRERKQASAENQPETANFDFLSNSSTSSWDETRSHVISAFHKLKQSVRTMFSAIKSKFSSNQSSNGLGSRAKYSSYGSYATIETSDDHL